MDPEPSTCVTVTFMGSSTKQDGPNKEGMCHQCWWCNDTVVQAWNWSSNTVEIGPEWLLPFSFFFCPHRCWVASTHFLLIYMHLHSQNFYLAAQVGDQQHVCLSVCYNQNICPGPKRQNHSGFHKLSHRNLMLIALFNVFYICFIYFFFSFQITPGHTDQAEVRGRDCAPGVLLNRHYSDYRRAAPALLPDLIPTDSNSLSLCGLSSWDVVLSFALEMLYMHISYHNFWHHNHVKIAHID